MDRCCDFLGYVRRSRFAGSDPANFMFDLVMLLFCLFILSVQFWDVACFFTI